MSTLGSKARDVVQDALDHSVNGVGVALITVIETSGSTPRHPGAQMYVTEEGVCGGTIGGGRVEEEAVLVARRVLTGEPCQRLRCNLVQDLAMCCGGTMELFIEPVSPHGSVLSDALQLRKRRTPCAVVTCLVDGTKRLVLDDIPQNPVRRGEVFVEPVWPVDRLILFGYGHLARAIGPLAASLGFFVCVCDDNETRAIDGEIPWANDVIASFSLCDVQRRLGALGARDHLLILTRDHAIDERLVEAALPKAHEVAYLGLIGSKGKVGRFKKRVLGKNPDLVSAWELLNAPMGLDIAAETPMEIAVSIMAQLILQKNRVTDCG